MPLILKRTRAGHVARVLGVNAALLAAAVVLLEMVFGTWIRGDHLNRLNIVRGRVLQFRTDALYPSPTGVVRYTRDRYGLRGTFKDPSEITLLTVGGSTTDQRFISDADTWQAVLQRRFEAAGERIVVGNAGVDGQSAFGHVKNFDWWFARVPALQPRHILFYVGLNDFDKEEAVRFDDLVTAPDKQTLRQKLRESSALYHLATRLYALYQAAVTNEPSHSRTDFQALRWTTTPMLSDYDALMRTRLFEYRQRLSVLLDKTRAFGSVPILVTQPSYRYRFTNGVLEGTTRPRLYQQRQINGVDYYHMIRRLDAVTCETARQRGLLCIDLAAARIFDGEDFYDFQHMTPRGTAKVGDALFEALHGRL
jgi:hypothetical protein